MTSVLTNETFLAALGLNVLLAMGLYVMVLTGQFSLGQAGFMAVGAYASSWANVSLGWPLASSVLFGIVLAAAVAVPIAFGAARVRGVYLIIGTLAVVQVIQTALTNIRAVGGVQGYFGMDVATLREIEVACVAVVALLFALARSRVGLAMRSVREDEHAAAAIGVATRSIRLGAVVLGASITGLAGALYAHYFGFIRPDGFGFARSSLITLFVVIGGTDTLLGPLVGAFVLTYLPSAFAGFVQYRGVVYGMFLVLVMMFSRRGLVTRDRTLAVRRAASRLRRRARSATRPATAGDLPAQPTSLPAGAEVLSVAGLRKRFAGVTALDGVDVSVRAGEVVGLIGPNGAGKTTLINVATGLLPATGGTVRLAGLDVTHLAAHQRARRGLARTFQAVRLFPHLTVSENVAAAAGVSERSRAHLPVLSSLGLVERAARLPGELPYGMQRRVQVAQAVVRRPVALLLDEPSIGLNRDELDELAAVIRRERDAGVAVLLVDHNLDLVMDLADWIVVLDFGRTIAQGTPAAVSADPTVQQAYLGFAVAAEF